ncbi:MAG: peptidoglycan-binding protein [Clostridia bacterium]|nr:peptidoglycan-binding protein [Clostridia bacterium]
MPQHTNEPLAIENLQRYLRQLSYHNPSIKAPPIDGIFESDTRTSLRDFQTLRGLPVTGKADRRTWDELYTSYRASLTEHTPPRTVAFFPFVRQTVELVPGNIGFAVSVLQHMLRELSANYNGLEPTDVTGTYDESTAQAVRYFQKHNSLPESGNTNASTWNAITDQYNILFATEPFL